MENFRRPYFARSIAEFWQRWHISLSTWFRDYLYIPLGGNRVLKWRWYYNIMVVFMVSGLWHGANWTFVVWGALHGFYLLASSWTVRTRQAVTSILRLDRYPKLHQGIKIAVTFHLTLLAWVFFRANSLGDALNIIGNFASLRISGLWRTLPTGLYNQDLSRGWFELLTLFGLLGLLLFVQVKERGGQGRDILLSRPSWVRWAAYYAMLLAIIIMGVYDHAEFIYFQF